MSEEVSPLKRKFEELEEEVRKLREPLESTLMDVRELISNLENPFNYATNLLGLGERSAEAGRVEEGDRRRPEDSDEEAEVIPTSIDRPPSSWKHRNLSALLCSYLLLKILGREEALSFLDSRHARRLAPINLIELLIDSIELLSCYEPVGKLPARDNPVFGEDAVFVAAYLIYSLASGADERFFTSLILALKALEADMGRSRR